MLTPALSPSGFIVSLSTVNVRRTARIRSSVSVSSSSSRLALCVKGATIAWPGLYGNLFSITIAPSGRHTTRAASGSSGFSITRQNRQPGGCSRPTYCMRHGAHSLSIDLRPFIADGHGRVGLDLRPGEGRSHTVPDAGFPADPVCARAASDGGARPPAAHSPGAAHRPSGRRGARRRLPDPDRGADDDEPRQRGPDHGSLRCLHAATQPRERGPDPLVDLVARHPFSSPPPGPHRPPQ